MSCVLSDRGLQSAVKKAGRGFGIGPGWTALSIMGRGGWKLEQWKIEMRIEWKYNLDYVTRMMTKLES